MTAAARYRNFLFDSARWDGFAFRPGDIVISTPPKSGTTWMQMICALLIFQSPRLGRPLSAISPWLDMLTRPLDAVLAELGGQAHRRFIKSHTPLDGLPSDERVTYLCVGRDPRDVALSFANHLANMDPAAFLRAREAARVDDAADLVAKGPPRVPDRDAERFRHWLDHTDADPASVATLPGTLHHLGTFWTARDRPNVVLVHYDDLLVDLEGGMRHVASRLGIEVPGHLWPELVRAATFAEMRRRADDVAPDADAGLWRDNQRFFHRGRSRQWEAVLDPDDLARYRDRVAELAAPDLSAWLHRPPL